LGPVVAAGRGADHRPAAARGARGVRARVPARADAALLGEYLPHRRLHRHGAVGPASQAEVARPVGRASNGRGSRVMGRIAYVNGRFVRQAEAAVHIEDRGYQLADAVYEVWSVM